MSWLFKEEHFCDPKEGVAVAYKSKEALAENNYSGMHKKVPLTFWHESTCRNCSGKYFWNNWNCAIEIVKVSCPFCSELTSFQVK